MSGEAERLGKFSFWQTAFQSNKSGNGGKELEGGYDTRLDCATCGGCYAGCGGRTIG